MRRISQDFIRKVCVRPLAKSPGRRSRLIVQSLEDRAVPTSFTVTSPLGDNSPGTLGDAIALANAATGADEIQFDTSGGAWGATNPKTISLTAALPQITGDLKITGTGVGNLDVDGAASFQVFNSIADKLTLTGFTVSGGFATTSNGGGLFARGAVTVDQMAFVNNQSTYSGFSFDQGNGGAIAIDRGNNVLVVKNSTISGNTASINGGGIFIQYGNNSLQIENSTLSGNATTYAGISAPYFGGGAIFAFGNRNVYPPNGLAAGTVVIRNSTIAENNTTGSGGGILLREFDGNVTLQNSTVSGNTALSGAHPGAFYATGGGGIGLYNSAGLLTLANSIVSGNVDTANAPDILAFYTVNAYFSAIGDTNGIGNPVLDSASTALVGAALNLGTLTDNGGPTLTMLPGSGPLIDGGSDALVAPGVNRDQRNLVRVYGSAIDIGAVEIQPPGLPFADAQAADVLAATAGNYIFSVVFSDPNDINKGIQVASVNGVNADNVVRVTGPNGFDVPATFISVTPTADGTPLTATYSITPPGGSWDPLDSGTYFVSLQAGQVLDLDGNAVHAGIIGTFQVQIHGIFEVTNDNPSGPGSLADAVAQANSIFTDDEITFDPVFFNTHRTISPAATLTISNTGGGLSIEGPGASKLTVDGGGTIRVLDSAAPTLTLSGFTVTGGLIDDPTGDNTGQFGAGLRAGGFVTLDHMVFTGNKATGPNTYYYDSGAGGGIGMKAGSFLLVRNTTIANNTADQKGAGIFMRTGGGLQVENSTISGNSITPQSGGAYPFFEGWGGAGIFFHGTPAIVVPAGFTPGNIVIQNSTLTGNVTPGSGGAFEAFGNYGSLLIQDSTITGNTSTTTSNYYGGGGLSARYCSMTITLQNSIVSGNTSTAAPDIMTYAYDTVFGDFSAIGDLKGIAYYVLDSVSTGLVNAPLMLSGLANFGGPTQTFTPLAGSPLIDAGDDTLVPGSVTTDQRGLDRIYGTAVDIGSFEVQPPRVTVEQAATQADPTNQPTITFDVTFTAPVTGFDPLTEPADLNFTGSTVGGVLSGVATQTGPSTYSVAVTGMTSDGTVVLSIDAGVAQDPAGLDNLASTSADNTVTYDTTVPTVTINKSGAQADPTNTGPITFDVVFSEPVVGFGLGSVNLSSSTGVGSPSVTSFLQTGPSSYTVSVTGMSGTGNVVAKVVANAVTDPAGNGNAASTSTDNSVAFDNTPPTVTINKGATQPDPTSVSPITFDIVLSEAVTGFTASDVDLSTSTAGGAFITNLIQVDPTHYTFTVDGVTMRGDLIAKIGASAFTDLAGNNNTASTSTDNAVAFLLAGVINFTTTTQNTTEGSTITVTASRTGGSDGIVSVDYNTLAGTAHVSDYTAGAGFTLAGTLTWGEGDAANKSFDIKIIDDTANEGRENFTVNMTNPVGGITVGSATTETVSIAPSDGQLIDGTAVKPAKPQFVFTDGDGDLVTVKLAGKVGTATVFITDPDGDGKGSLELMQLAGTDATKSIVTITAKKAKGGSGNGRAGLAEMTGVDLKALNAATTDMVGLGITMSGFLNTVAIGSLGGGADITVAGAAPAGAKGAKTGLSLTTLSIGDGTDITLAQVPLLKLKAYSVGTGGTISAPYAGTIQTTGNKKAGNAGDFGSNITLSGIGVPAKTLALKSLNIKGAANGILIKVASGTGTVGDVGSVTVGSFINSRLFAGYSGPDNGSGAFNLAATIGKFTATNATTSFAHSFVIGTNFKQASKLASVDTANGGTKFGFVFHGTYGGLNLPSLKLHYNTKTQGTQTFGGDLEVLKL